MNMHMARVPAGIETKSGKPAGGIDGETMDEIGREFASFVEEMKGERQKQSEELTDITERLDGIDKKIGRGGLGGSKGDDERAVGAERKALASFARTGSEVELRSVSDGGGQIAGKSMSVGSDPDGGFMVHTALSSRITKRIFDQSPIRRIARVETITTGDAWEEPLDLADVEAVWVSEKQARPETGTPTGGVFRVPVHELYAMPKLTQRLLDDAGINVGAWIEGKVADKFARTEGRAFVLGDGIEKPRGFATHPVTRQKDADRPWGTFQAIPTGSAADLTPDGLKNMVWALRSPYRQGATWVMNSNTASKCDLMKDDQGQYMWRTAFTSGVGASLLGYPVEIDENMPDVAAGSRPIAFGNFKEGYVIVDKSGIKWLRDPFTQKPYVLIYAYRRVGGSVANFEAIKFAEVSAG